MNRFQSIGIIGFGQFGSLLEIIFQKHLPNSTIKIYSRSDAIDEVRFFGLEEVCKCDLIIPAVPMRSFEEVIQKISPLLKKNSTILDVCSVKVYPQEILSKYIPDSINIILSHPMFGPGTYKYTSESLENLNWVIWNSRSNEAVYEDIKSFLLSLKLNVVEISPDEHDKLSAKFQFLTQVIAFMFKEINLKPSKIDTKSAKLVLDLIEIVKSDKELTKDMYKFNPFVKQEFIGFENSLDNIKKYITE